MKKGIKESDVNSLIERMDNLTRNNRLDTATEIPYSNGSVTSLARKGMTNGGTYGLIDALTITYDGNRLKKVDDSAPAVNYYGALDFNDGANQSVEYEYNGNGALTRDRNRGITNIAYDYSGNPMTITLSGRKKIEFDYTSDGRKLSCKQQAAGMATSTDLYIDGLILRDDVPLMWKREDGYVSLNSNGTPTSWNYYIQDHLGSTRLVVDSNNSTKETINYYPYGSEMTMAIPSSPDPNWQPYRFTGKELVKQNGLNMYDFGARLFDVAGVPMWTSMDPLAEKYYHLNPYMYCAGDPVNYIDMNGDSIEVRQIELYGEMVGEDYLNNIIYDLSLTTGLQFYINNGFLFYSNDNGTGSNTAKEFVKSCIDSSEKVEVFIYNKGSRHQGGKIGLNPEQITAFINGTFGVDPKTLGWGMTLIHELMHSPAGGNLKDNNSLTYPGDVVTRMNVIRKELDASGANFGQRLTYPAYNILNLNYLPFSSNKHAYGSGILFKNH